MMGPTAQITLAVLLKTSTMNGSCTRHTRHEKKTQNSSLVLVSISAEVFVPHLPVGGVVFGNFDTH